MVVTTMSSSKMGTKSGVIRLECLLVSGNDLTTIWLVSVAANGSSNEAFFFLMMSLRSSSVSSPLPFRDSWSECELIRLSISARSAWSLITLLRLTFS